MQRNALFDLLARSPASVCVVTSNRRLARALTLEFDQFQTDRSQRVWETPQIVPFGAFVAELHDGVRHDPDLTGVRTPLTPAQERSVWEAVVVDSQLGLLSPAAAATLAADAWKIAHQWAFASRVRRYVSVADTQIFVSWAAEYQRRVAAAGGTDLARLPDIVCDYVESGAIPAPQRLVLAGFDETTVQQQRLFDALAVRGAICDRFEPTRHDAKPLRAACFNERDENEAMADWVAARVAADPSARIGIVVPDLASRRRSLVAALDAALVPDQSLERASALPYSVSLGKPLSDVPLIAFCLRVIRLTLSRVSLEEASAALRSPYFNGAARERDTRDLIDAQLRRRCPRSVDFAAVFDATQASARECNVEAAQLLAALRTLNQWRRQHTARAHRPSEWATAFAQLLQSVGAFSAGGDRVLDSPEYQAFARWQELLIEFAGLDRTVGRWSAELAAGKLEGLAGATVFQPESGTPPVQVLGVLEANALTFDHLWIMGLTADAWPPPAKPAPLLPIELQRAVGLPGADAAMQLQRARRQLQALLQSAPEIVVSHATHDADRTLAPSPLIAEFASWKAAPRAARLIDALTPVTLMQSYDAVAPPWRPIAPLRGGAALLQNQAACPFRAFAIHRLNARPIEAPHDGFDYRERGQLVHDTLAGFWTSLPEPTRDALAATSDEQRRVLLVEAARAAQARLQRRRGNFSPALAELECARLVRVIGQWLQYEVEARAAFRVVAVEESRTMHVGPLSLAARLDRVDEVSNGARIVIDYKTGGGKNPGWLDERPDEPQLPLYLVASESAARAIALARVRVGDIVLGGYASDSGLLPGRSNYWSGQFPSWEALVAHWSAVLERLAMQFATGDAAVNPKRLPQTCRYCDLPTLCRINERGGAVVRSVVDDEDGAPWVRDEE